jgi:hypothetical protein
MSEDEIEVLVRVAEERAALGALGVDEEQYKILNAHRKAKQDLEMAQGRERAKRLKDLGDKVSLPKVGPGRMDHWACLTFLDHVRAWREVPEHLQDVDDQLFQSILLNHLSGHPHQLISAHVASIRQKHSRPAEWSEIEKAFTEEYLSKTPKRDNRVNFYQCKWESGTLSNFVSQFRVLLTRCQGDGIFLEADEVVACDYFLRAIGSHAYAKEQLRRNQGDKLEEWEQIDDLLTFAQTKYGHLTMVPDYHKRQRSDGGRFGQSTREDGGKPGRGREAQKHQGVEDTPQSSQQGGGHKSDRTYLSVAAKEWYRAGNRCFRCGIANHPTFRCRAAEAKLAVDLPANLREECEKKVP